MFELGGEEDDMVEADGRKHKKACAGCGSIDRKLLKCSGCKCVRYCSKACQTKHWKNHKKLCKIISSAKAKGAPRALIIGGLGMFSHNSDLWFEEGSSIAEEIEAKGMAVAVIDAQAATDTFHQVAAVLAEGVF